MSVPASRLIAQAGIMEIEPTAMRMALGRLLREGMAAQVARGTYTLGRAATTIHAKARRWADTGQRLRAWQGGWIVVLVDHLGRTNRRRLHARERALRLTGFRDAAAGAWVRPDNLPHDADALAVELRGLGLDEEAIILVNCAVTDRDDTRFRRLWHTTVIEDGYRHWLAELAASTTRLPGLNVAEAARETFLLGQSVIRAINSDPLLPTGMIDAALRQQLVDAMKDYDATGRRIWAAAVPATPSVPCPAVASDRDAA